MNLLLELKNWFLKNKRKLPWRKEPTPYRVWVSEIMLQQTRAEVVVPYFEKWMEQFPSITDLANADIADVIKIWEGLGYYSRARNLYQGAKYILHTLNGELPSSMEELEKIKGIGPYTIGAIQSFAFKMHAPAVDGNVLRVTSRYYGISEDISLPKVQKRIRHLVKELLPDEEPWVIMEALIELGALVCKKIATCSVCPLRSSCRAYLDKTVEVIPYKARKVQYEKIYRVIFIIRSGDFILLRKGVKGEIMEDLYEFPYFQTFSNEVNWEEAINNSDLRFLNFHLESFLPIFKQSFTRFRVELFPAIFKLESKPEIKNYYWVHRSDLLKYPFSSGHRKILQYYLQSIK